MSRPNVKQNPTSSRKAKGTFSRKPETDASAVAEHHTPGTQSQRITAGSETDSSQQRSKVQTLSPEALNCERAIQIIDKHNRQRIKESESLYLDRSLSQINANSEVTQAEISESRRLKARMLKQALDAQVAEREASRMSALEETGKERRQVDDALRFFQAEEAAKAEGKLIRRRAYICEVNELGRNKEICRQLQREKESRDSSDMIAYQKLTEERAARELSKREEIQAKRSQNSQVISKSIQTEKQRIEKLAESRSRLYAAEQESKAFERERLNAMKALQNQETLKEGIRSHIEQQSDKKRYLEMEKILDRVKADEVTRQETALEAHISRNKIERQRSYRDELDKLIELKHS